LTGFKAFQPFVFVIKFLAANCCLIWVSLSALLISFVL
jgi:hypothetical protein